MIFELFRLSDDDFWNLLHAKYNTCGGVYKIIAVKNDQRVPINRFLGTDGQEILYIGKATSYIDRVVALKRSIASNYKGTSHICGRRYKYNPKIASLFPYETLYIELIPSDSPETLEKKLIIEYSNEFGEVPPLNAV